MIKRLLKNIDKMIYIEFEYPIKYGAKDFNDTFKKLIELMQEYLREHRYSHSYSTIAKKLYYYAKNDNREIGVSRKDFYRIMNLKNHAHSKYSFLITYYLCKFLLEKKESKTKMILKDKSEITAIIDNINTDISIAKKFCCNIVINERIDYYINSVEKRLNEIGKTVHYV